MRFSKYLTTLILVGLPCFAQQTMYDLDGETPGLFITAPPGVDQSAYMFGTVPPGDGTNGQGLATLVKEGEGLRLFAPTAATGPGLVYVRCSVSVDSPDVALAIAALNVPAGGTLADADGSITTNQLANGSEFVGRWGQLDAIIDPADDGAVPLIQAVATSAQPVIVYFDEIVVTPLIDLPPVELREVLDTTRGSEGASSDGQSVIDLGSEIPGMVVTAPEGYSQGSHTFGVLPAGDPTNGQALSVAVDQGQAWRLFAPPVTTGPGLVYLRCWVHVDSSDVALAIAALNVTVGGTFADMDGSITTNQLANGAEFVGRWGRLDTIIDPAGNAVVPLIQAVATGSQPVTVYFDEIAVTPLANLSAEGIVELLDPERQLPPAEPTPTPQPGGEIVINPQNAGVLAKDSILFKVFDSENRNIHWSFKVDNFESSGIRTLEGDPSSAIYTAPDVTQRTIVRVSAAAPNDESLSVSTTVTVYPLLGDLAIRPANPTVALGRSQRFEAGMDVEDIGFIPLKNVFWKLNGVLGGNADIGKIDAFGLYHAPTIMPDTLPMALNVGFSFDRDDPVEISVPLKIAELLLTPPKIVATEAGAAGPVKAFLRTSDNNLIVPVPPADLFLDTVDKTIATINPDGTLFVAEKLGRTTIVGEHMGTLATATALLYSRSDVRLIADVQLLPGNFARIERAEGGDPGSVIEIEFTHPEGMFYFAPLVEILRGHGVGTKFSGINSDLITITTDGNIIAYNRNVDPIPHPTGVLATIETTTGAVIIGDQPGEGLITATYDDGYVQHSVTIKVIFTRLDIALSSHAKSSTTPGEAYITEPFFVEVFLRNSLSEFIDETPLRVTLVGANEEEEEFIALFGLEPCTSKSVRPSMYPINLADELTELRLTVPSTLDPLTSQGGQPWTPTDDSPITHFWVAPKRIGEHRFRIEVANDRDIPPQEVTILVKRPPLLLRELDFGVILDELETTIVCNSWAEIREDHRVPDKVSIFDLYNDGSLLGTESNNPPVWTILDPESGKKEIPMIDTQEYSLRPFPCVFEEPGRYTVYLGTKNRPELRTEPVFINVVEPEAVANAGTQKLVYAVVEGQEILTPRDSQVGTFKILSPVGGNWAPGEDIEIRIQMYNALGVPKAIGNTFISYNRHYGGEVLSESRLYGVRVAQIAGPPIEISGNLWPDATGLVTFKITPSEPLSDEEVDLPGERADDLVLRFSPVLLGPFDPTTGNPIILEWLPEEVINFTFVEGEPGTFINRTYVPHGIANFVDPDDRNTFHVQGTILNGRGLSIEPRDIPVASANLRASVDRNILPKEALEIRFAVEGASEFANLLQGGPASVNLGAGLHYIRSEIDKKRLLITAETDVDAALGEREISVTFGDGSEWKGMLNLFKVRLGIYGARATYGIPLNANHNNDHEIATEEFIAMVEAGGDIRWSPDRLQKIELELVPSVMPGQTFRGAEPECPLVGFRREVDPETGLEMVSDLTK
ncbi:MAG: hypothetical protein ABIH23_17940, partial [bacterium]